MPASLPVPKTYTYKTDSTGCEIGYDVYVPEKIEKPCPVIVWMNYSGPVFDNHHTVGTHMFFYSGLNRGNLVVNIDYRLAPQVEMKGTYQDLEDCVTWCKDLLSTGLGNGVVDTVV